MSYQAVDFGKVVLQDPRTGDVYLDKDGNLVSIEGLELVTQEVKVALKTIKNEEAFSPEYGFDLMGVLDNKDNMTSYYIIGEALREALDTSNIPHIKEAHVLDIKENRDDIDDIYYEVSVGFVTLNNDEKIVGLNLGEFA